jgi:hypothetical protein
MVYTSPQRAAGSSCSTWPQALTLKVTVLIMLFCLCWAKFDVKCLVETTVSRMNGRTFCASPVLVWTALVSWPVNTIIHLDLLLNQGQNQPLSQCGKISCVVHLKGMFHAIKVCDNIEQQEESAALVIDFSGASCNAFCFLNIYWHLEAFFDQLEDHGSCAWNAVV